MLTLAIATFHERVSARLDCSETILLVTINDGEVVQRVSMTIPANDKRKTLEHLGVQVLICGGLTSRCVAMLRGSSIRVLPWVQGDVEDVLADFLARERGGA